MVQPADRPSARSGTWKRSPAHRAAAGFLAIPTPWLWRLCGVEDPIVRDGRALHPALVAMLAVTERLGMQRTVADVATRRAELARLAAVGVPVRKDVRVVDRVADLDGIERPVRIYRPFGIDATLPAITYFHGGGWVTGDLDSHDACCRILAAEARAVVVAVDYRLAPEDPFPAAVDDAIAGYRWVVAHAPEIGADPDRVAVMGDSAGGTLAAVVSQQLTDHDDIVPPPVAQGLIYPATDANFASASIDLFAEGFFLGRSDMEWFRDQYLADRTAYDDVRASPLLAHDFAGLPPALVITAGFDPLRDEGDAYAAKLEDAGVRVIHRCYDDMVHGFFGMAVLPGGLDTIVEICQAMGALLDRPHRDSSTR